MRRDTSPSDGEPLDDEAILHALEQQLDLDPYNELDWLTGVMYRGARQLEMLGVRPELSVTEGRDIPFGHLGQDTLNGEFFVDDTGAFRGTISIQSEDSTQQLQQITRNPTLGQWLSPITRAIVDGVEKPVRKRYTDNGVLRHLEKRLPWDGRYGTDRIRSAAANPSDHAGQDLYEIFHDQFLPAAEMQRTTVSYIDSTSHTSLEVERTFFKGNTSPSDSLVFDNEFKMSFQRAAYTRENGVVVKAVSAAHIDESGNIGIEAYLINTVTNERKVRKIVDLPKFTAYLLGGLDMLITQQSQKVKH